MMAKVDVNGAKRRSALRLAEAREEGPARQRGDQVELHQVPGRPRRRGGRPLRAQRHARSRWRAPSRRCSVSDSLRPHRHRRRARRLCRRHPRQPARPEDRHRRARGPGRHLPELGLHPDQGAAEVRRGLRAARPSGRLRPVGRRAGPRLRQGDRALAQGRQAALVRRRLPDEEAQDRGGRAEPPGWRRASRRPTVVVVLEGRRRAHADGQVGDPGHRRPGADHPRRRPGAGRRADLDLSRGHGPQDRAQVPAGGRLRRHRHRVRQLLPGPGLRGDGDRGPAAHPAGGGRGGLHGRAEGLREARPEVPRRRQGRDARQDRRRA